MLRNHKPWFDFDVIIIIGAIFIDLRRNGCLGVYIASLSILFKSTRRPPRSFLISTIEHDLVARHRLLSSRLLLTSFMKSFLKYCFKIINHLNISLISLTKSSAIYESVFIVYITGKHANEDTRSTTGMVHKSVKMRCNVSQWFPKETLIQVEWYDYAHNSDDNPIQIFSSINNSEFQVNSWHPNFKDMEIEPDYTLTINLLDKENDSGNYFCKVRYDNNNTRTHSYYLSISGFSNIYLSMLRYNGSIFSFKHVLSYVLKRFY